MTSILKVSEIQDPTNSNTALTIDSAGRVLMPKNPALYVHTWSGTNGTRTNGNSNAASLTYSTVVTDDGSCWNNTIGEFTCPVAGRYYVTANFSRRLDSTTWFGGIIEHNTTKMAQAWHPPANPADTNWVYITMSLTCIVNAVVNDTIAPCYYTNYSAPGTGNVTENSFTIMYIG
jgi:hypothetical protein